MSKVYLVINSWSSESSGEINMQNIYIYSSYKKAKEKFNEIKENIKSFELGYDEINDDEDYYCEWVNGEYLYYHEQVYIKEKEVL